MSDTPALPTYDDIVDAAARLEGVAVGTPLLEVPLLNEAAGCRLLVKAESLQRTGSFKLRGAWNRISRLNDAEKARGVLCYSSGNHAQAVAHAAALAGTQATVVMPATAPALKVARCKAYGATVIQHEGDRRSMVARAEQIARDENRVLVPPFDDPHVIAGQGTVGLEIVDDLLARGIIPEVVLIPCGGGGLAAGVSTAIAQHFPETAIHGVEPAGYDDTARSLAAGTRTAITPGAVSLCDALLVPEPGVLTFAINRMHLRNAVTVGDGEVRHAMAAGFAHLKVVIEPGGAAALAAALSAKVDVADKTVIVIASGGNVDAAVFAQAITRDA